MKHPPLWIGALGMEQGSAVIHASSAETGQIESDEMPHLTPGWGGTAAQLGDVLAEMEYGGLGQLWIHPSWFTAADLANADTSHWWLSAREGWETPDKLGPWLIGKHLRQERMVALPSLEHRAPWTDAPDARALLSAVLRYNALLGIPYQFSPGATGTALIRQLHAKPGATDITRCEHLPDVAKEGDLEGVFMWTRRPSPQELRVNTHLHIYDKNAQFLGAASSLPLGTGEPMAGAGWPMDGDLLGKPGYWMIRAPIPVGDTLPDPLRPRQRHEPEDLVWVTTPTLRLALEHQLVREIRMWYVWPQATRMLETWYKVLRDALRILKAPQGTQEGEDAARVAREAVKATYTYTFAWMGLRDRWFAEGTPSELWRPDWRHHVIGQARANFFRNISALAYEEYPPLAVDADEVAVFSTSDDPVGCKPPCLRLGDDLGAFKVKASMPLALIRPELEAMRERDARKRWRAWEAISAVGRAHPWAERAGG